MRVNLYVRVEDEKKFEAIKDRPDWLHWAIQNAPVEETKPKKDLSRGTVR